MLAPTVFSIRGKLLIGALEIAAAVGLVLTVADGNPSWHGIEFALVSLSLLAIVFAVLLGHSIAARVDALVRATRRIGEGDYLTPVEPAGGDELGSLAGEIDDMRKTLRTEVELLESMNQRLEQTVAERTREVRDAHQRLSLLHETTEAVQSSLDVGRIFDEVLTGTRRLVEFHQASLARIVEGGRAEVFAFSPSGEAAEAGRTVDLATSRIGRAVAERRALVFDSPGPAVEEDSLRMTMTRREVVIPLLAGDQVIGTFNLGSRQAEAFSARDLEVLEPIASSLAVALLRAETFARERDAARELSRLSNLKSSFIARASHELRTPLAAIIGALDNLIDGITGPLADRPRDYLLRMRGNASRLVDLVEELLTIGRIEAGREELRPSRVALDRLVASTIEDIRPLAESRGIRLSSDVPSLEISADPDKLRRVLVNLIDNAVRFTPAGGRVDVAAAAHDEGVRLTVHDDGIGIAPAEVEQVFEPFHRSSTTTSGPGFGLGLTICRELVEMHGGAIRAESRPGGGTTFVVELPSEPLDKTSTSIVSWPESSSSTTTRTSVGS